MSDAQKPCPICGNGMIFMYGCGWDYDRWICPEYLYTGEIELSETTYPEEEKTDETHS